MFLNRFEITGCFSIKILKTLNKKADRDYNIEATNETYKIVDVYEKMLLSTEGV